MVVSLKHSKVSAIADGGDETVVQPSDWNAEHVLRSATAIILGRITAGDGVVEELSKADVLNFLNVENGATGDLTASEIWALLAATGFYYDEVNQRVALGQEEYQMVVNGATIPSKLAVHSDAIEALYEGHSHTDTAGWGAIMYGARSRGSEVSEAVVQSGDTLLSIYAVGYDGTDYAVASHIALEVDGTPGDNDMPGRIRFLTTADGAATPTEAMRINADQSVQIASVIRADVNGGAALGTSTVGWSDLFLATSGVVDWANGAATITGFGSSGTLILSADPGNTIASTVLNLQVDGATVLSVYAGGAAVLGALELGHASDTTLARSAAGVVTLEGSVIQTAGKQTIWIPATAMIARTTNGAAAGSVETTTNRVMLKTLDFDTTTQEFAQFAVHMPKSWDEGTVTFQAVWSHPSTATNFGVVWALQGLALSDDDAADAAFGTEQTATDTGGTTNDIYISPESAAITIAGSPAENDYVVFQVKRNPAAGSDTLAVDARLHGIKLFYTTNAKNDA